MTPHTIPITNTNSDSLSRPPRVARIPLPEGTAMLTMKPLLMGISVLAVLTLTACVSNAPGEAEPGSTKGDKGAVAMSFAAPSAVALWNEALDIMRPIVEDAGYEFLSDDPAGVAQTQVSSWEAWLARGDVRAIMGYPVQSDSLIPVTTQASDGGTPVLAWAAPWDGVSASMLVDGYDDGMKLGTDAGKWALDKYGDSAVEVTLIGYWDNDFGRLRSEGIEAGLEASGANVSLNKVTGVNLEEGSTAVQNALSSHPETKVWLAFAADPAVGAYQALVDSGVSATDDTVLFGSLDVSDQVIDVMLADKSIWRLAYASTTRSLAEAAAALLIAAAEGEEVADVTVASEKVTELNAESFRSEDGAQ